ncbi:hypothetical protein [Marinobacter sp. X15-166B]|uniref:hypothetical protein n=1 Tax=Marinobacter sp. X15-166B TaxID=1897620 RepID=UPI00085CD3B1|nr:hypothetical protein [Marinobacter sp. X15-166B]OEY67585.1 hypothetical protein BG841_14850 [Marinobacter sp. X15-166B]
MTKKVFPSLVALASLAAPIVSAADSVWPTFMASKLTTTIELVGGVFMNDHLKDGAAGREHQIKLTRALAGLTATNGPWQARLEFVGLGDEMYQDSSDPVYRDIYRNLGTDLYYYGDHPLREAWVGRDHNWMFWQVGRFINFMGTKPGGLYLVSPEAPNAALMATGIFNGARMGVRGWDDRIHIGLGIMGGDDKPRLGANNYLGGKLDVNEKGNNTPVFEAFASISPINQLTLYTGYLMNKEGSAVGSFTSGKHNDQRMVFGIDYRKETFSWLTLDFKAQGSWFVTGLTEEGSQGESTPNESFDIDQKGVFLTARATLPAMGLLLQYTHEKMDRMDALAWMEVANFDQTHPVNSATESRDILAIGKLFASGFEVRAFYRQDDVPYLTGKDQKLEDRSGLVFSYNANF